MSFREPGRTQYHSVRAVHSVADPDSVLIEAVRRGETGSFEPLVHRHERKIFSVAHKITRNHADAQDTLLRAFKHLDSFRGDSLFSTWLTKIAVTLALMKVRGRDTHVVSLENETHISNRRLIDEIQDKKPTLEQECLRQELHCILAEMIGRLDPRYRAVFHLRDVEALSIAETSALLGLSPSVVKSRLLRVRLQVRQSLNRRFRRKSVGRQRTRETTLLSHC